MPAPERLVALVEYALKGALGPVVARLAALDLRLEALETRPPQSGPPGPPGAPGEPGPPGINPREKYELGLTYSPRDGVPHDGSYWLCLAETTAKPGTNGDWKLIVKRGKDGRDVRREG